MLILYELIVLRTFLRTFFIWILHYLSLEHRRWLGFYFKGGRNTSRIIVNIMAADELVIWGTKASTALTMTYSWFAQNAVANPHGKVNISLQHPSLQESGKIQNRSLTMSTDHIFKLSACDIDKKMWLPCIFLERRHSEFFNVLYI